MQSTISPTKTKYVTISTNGQNPLNFDISITPSIFTQTNKNIEVKQMNFIDLFAGIGGIHTGFKEYFGDCVFASEWDKYSQISYLNNYGFLPSGDITQIDEKLIPSFDILLAGFPCQPFSNAGLKKGFDDTRGTLFFDIVRILKHHKPRIVFLENVKAFKNHDKGNTFKVIKENLEELGYKLFSKVLNAKDFGLPQNRERFYMIGFLDDVEFSFPEKYNIKTKLGDILENNPDPKYTISDKLWAGHQRRKIEHKEKGNGFGYSIFNEDSEYTSTISARYYKDGSEILIEQKGKNPRKLTPREALRLQGYPENYKIAVSDAQVYKQVGNSVAIPVIKALAKSITKSITKLKS